MSQDEFTRIFNYMEKRFDASDAKQDQIYVELKGEMNDIRNILDSLLAKSDTDEQERLVMGHQLGRHEAWLERAADKLKLKYDPSN